MQNQLQYSDKAREWMQRCFQLAEMGLGHTAPNPLVGCVIVHEGKIIGEGFHREYGGPHAEVNAIRNVSNPSLLRESTLYVNLEPCSHVGKTPPCTNLILEQGIPKVVIANKDPFPQVSGRGIERLREGGVDVQTGLLQHEGAWLNRRFFTFHLEKRPYIILKWAETQDGFMDRLRKPGSAEPPLKITGPEANRLVHKWRAEEPAILVGKNTALLDNPRLTTRLWPGKNPLRVLIDPQLESKNSLHMLSDEHDTWIYNAKQEGTDRHLRYHRISDPENFLREILASLYGHNIQSLIVEGGRNTLQRFIEKGLWEEARILTGPQRIGNGLPAPSIHGNPMMPENLGPDKLQILTRP